MYKRISDGLTRMLIKNGIVGADMEEVYSFGFENIVSRMGTIIFLAVAGLILSALPEAAIFFFTFLLMRKYAGGYHADTYVRCNTAYLLTFAACVGLSGILARFDISGTLSLCICAFCIVTVALVSPIENPNNPIISGKHKIFYIFSILLTFTLSIIVAVLIFLRINLHVMLSLSMLAAAVFMYVEILHRKIKNVGLA